MKFFQKYQLAARRQRRLHFWQASWVAERDNHAQLELASELQHFDADNRNPLRNPEIQRQLDAEDDDA